MFNYLKHQTVPEQNLNSKVKIDLAAANKKISKESQNNGDLEKYKDNTKAPYAGSFRKTFAHNANGQITNVPSYEQLLKSLNTGLQSDFDAIVLNDNNVNKLADPQASLNYVLIGLDNSSVMSLTPPALESDAHAAEMVELYCKELARDIPFKDWSGNATITLIRDTDHINKADVLAAFNGPTTGGVVTLNDLFRGAHQGYQYGPYISQLLYYEIPYGAMKMRQQYTVLKDKVLYNGADPSTDPTNPASSPVDFGVNKSAMVNIQNGGQDNYFNITDDRYQSTTKFLYNGRSLASLVHNDQLFQHYYNAAQILLNLGAPVDSGFKNLPNEKNFTSYGGPADILHHVAALSGIALKHAWYHKWQVHLRLRPEATSLLVQNRKENVPGFNNFLSNVLINNNILDDIKQLHIDYYNVNNSYLLSSAFPEGSPTHPSYPAGHAVVAGACVTLLKIIFKGDEQWQNLPHVSDGTKRVKSNGGTPFIVAQATSTGSDLCNYGGGDIANITVNSELNKLAWNISLGRDWANVHYRSDGDWGNLIGEELAIRYMKDILSTYNQNYNADKPIELTLEKFDGSVVKIIPNLD